MESIESDIVIIGGGLTGLTLAYLLKDKNLRISLVEARDRLGGRIYTRYKTTSAPIEMGATWLGSKHVRLTALLQALQIETFQQVLGEKAIYEPISNSPHQLVTLPHNPEPSYRLQGGTSVLIQQLATYLPLAARHLNQKVTTISADKTTGTLRVATNQHLFQAPIVVSTLPPHLLHATLSIQPSLPTELTEVMEQTHTWMGESIKIGLRFAKPFWRKANSSGTVFSNVGPIPELYDHSDYEDQNYALKGFLNGTYFSLQPQERLDLILLQLRKYYGPQTEQYLDYEEAVWRQDPFTFAPYQGHVLPHQNNGHQLYQNAYLAGKLFIAGAETAAQYPGYMEGAVRSAEHVYQQLAKTGKI